MKREVSAGLASPTLSLCAIKNKVRFASMFEAMLAAFLPLAIVTAIQRVSRIHRRLVGSGRARDV